VTNSTDERRRGSGRIGGRVPQTFPPEPSGTAAVSRYALAAAALLVGTAAPACKKTTDPEPPPTETAAPRPAPARPTPRDDPRFTCREDRDCVATCALGAVSRAWWRRHGAPYTGCEDGCASKGYFARCIQRACVTFRRHNGTVSRVAHCTFRPLPRPRPRPPRRPTHPAGAYRCRADADCVGTCASGALNRAWYEKHEQQLRRCRDGCLGPGLRIRCVEGVCTTFNHRTGMKKPVLSCTRKKIGWRR
jgi:hypothetical protein